MELGLKNKQVVVTGGTRGIGLAIVRAFLGEGATVHIIARNTNDDLLNELKNQYASPVYFYPCDVTNAAALEQISLKIGEEAGGVIDILVSNVGSGSSVPEPIPMADHWDTVWNTNFHSALNTVRIFHKGLRTGSGSVLFISSIAGTEYLGAPTDYSVAKTALISLAKNLSHKLAPGIRVNAIAPGNIYFNGGSWEKRANENPEKIKKYIQERVPLQRFGKPEEIANLALFLSSDRASFITGSCVVIDGGQTNRI